MDEGVTMDTKEGIGLEQWAKQKIESILSSGTAMSSNRNSNIMNNNNSSKSSSSKNNNKRQKNLLDVNNDCNNVVLMVSGLPLTRMVSYLEPRDVLNCIQTCKKWNNDIDKDGVWCEVAKVFSPNAVAAIIQQENNNNTAPDVNYRNMAIALSRKVSEHKLVEFPESRLLLKDILVVIEIRDRGNKNMHLGAFCSDLTDFTESEPGSKKHLTFDPSNDSKKDPFSSVILPRSYSNDSDVDDDDYDYGCVAAIKRLEMTSRLIRRDTGRSFCINDYDTIDDFGNDGSEAYFTTNPDLKPTAQNRAGSIAREVCFQHKYNYVSFDLNFSMDKISGFEYKIKSFEFQLRVSRCDDCYADDTFESMHHFLLFLEGLDWK